MPGLSEQPNYALRLASVVALSLMLVVALSSAPRTGTASGSFRPPRAHPHGLPPPPQYHPRHVRANAHDDGSAVALSAFADRRVALDGLEGEMRVLESPNAAVDAGKSAFVVVLLHGAAYSADTWADLGTLVMLAGNGYKVLAVDLPGRGQTTIRASAVDRDSFLALALRTLDVYGRAVVVTPSMSGTYVYPLLEADAAALHAFVPVAPAGTDGYFSQHRTKPIDLPTEIFWGDLDETFPLPFARQLADCFVKARVEILPNAGHAAYMDQPEQFHERLLSFLGSL